MDATTRSPSRQPARNNYVAVVVVLSVLGATALGLVVAVAVAAYLLFQILTPAAVPAPVVTVQPPVVAIAQPTEVPAVAAEAPRTARPVEPPVIILPPVAAPPVATKPSFVPKPPPPAATPKPGPTPSNPVTPDLPHARYDPAVDPDSFEGILSEEYPEPGVIDGKIVSYLKFVSPKGDYIGQGKTLSYDLFGANPPRFTHTSGVSVAAGSWGLDVAPQRGSKSFGVGKYLGAARFPFNKPSEPGLSFSGDGRGSNTLTGSFAVWQLDIEDGQVVALAVDFLQRCEGRGPPLVGRLRYKSRYE